MSQGRTAERTQLAGLMYRMLGGLLLFGAALLLGLAVLLSRLPRVDVAGGAMLLLPGTQGRHMMSATAIPVLGACGLMLGLPGALAIALARRQAPFRPALRRPMTRRPMTRRPMTRRSAGARRASLVLIGGLAVLAWVLFRHR